MVVDRENSSLCRIGILRLHLDNFPYLPYKESLNLWHEGQQTCLPLGPRWKFMDSGKSNRERNISIIHAAAAAAAGAAKSLQSCPTLCDPIDGSPPGSTVPRILQARTLESVAISFSNAWKWKVKGKSFSCVQLLATPWTAAYQAPPSMGFSRQEYWSGVPLPSPMTSLPLNNVVILGKLVNLIEPSISTLKNLS